MYEHTEWGEKSSAATVGLELQSDRVRLPIRKKHPVQVSAFLFRSFVARVSWLLPRTARPINFLLKVPPLVLETNKTYVKAFSDAPLTVRESLQGTPLLYFQSIGSVLFVKRGRCSLRGF